MNGMLLLNSLLSEPSSLRDFVVQDILNHEGTKAQSFTKQAQ